MDNQGSCSLLSSQTLCVIKARFCLRGKHAIAVKLKRGRLTKTLETAFYRTHCRYILRLGGILCTRHRAGRYIVYKTQSVVPREDALFERHQSVKSAYACATIEEVSMRSLLN
jgi:hypothetical protein